MVYNYDLGGDVTSWDHPGGFTLTNTITQTQRILQIQSSLSDSTHPATLATITYVAPGGGYQQLAARRRRDCRPPDSVP